MQEKVNNREAFNRRLKMEATEQKAVHSQEASQSGGTQIQTDVIINIHNVHSMLIRERLILQLEQQQKRLLMQR